MKTINIMILDAQKEILTHSETEVVCNAFKYGFNKWSAKHHSFKAPWCMAVLKECNIKNEKLRKIAPLLILEEIIFQSVDDSLDEKLDKKSEYYNEIIKIYGFVLLSRYFFEFQMKNKNDLFSIVLGRKVMVEQVIFELLRAMHTITKIPEKEADVIKSLKKRRTVHETASLVISGVVNRSANIEIYVDLANIMLKTKPFNNIKKLLFIERSLQLLCEDIEDIEIDKKNKTYNTYNAMEQTHNRKEIGKIIEACTNIFQNNAKIHAKEELHYCKATKFITKKIDDHCKTLKEAMKYFN